LNRNTIKNITYQLKDIAYQLKEDTEGTTANKTINQAIKE